MGICTACIIAGVIAFAFGYIQGYNIGYETDRSRLRHAIKVAKPHKKEEIKDAENRLYKANQEVDTVQSNVSAFKSQESREGIEL